MKKSFLKKLKSAFAQMADSHYPMKRGQSWDNGPAPKLAYPPSKPMRRIK